MLIFFGAVYAVYIYVRIYFTNWKKSSMWPLGLIVLHGLCMAVILQFFRSSISCSFLLLNSRPCLCWLQENASELQVEEWKKDTVYSRGIHKKCLSPKWKKAGDLWPVIFGLSFSSRFFILTNKHMHERNDRVKNCPVAVDRYFTRRNVKGIAWAAWQIWLSDIEISGLANWCEDMAFLTFEDWDVRLLAKKPSKYFQPWQVWKGSFTSTFQFGQWPRWGSHGHLAIFKMDPGEGTTRFATGDLRCRFGCALTGFYG